MATYQDRGHAARSTGLHISGATSGASAAAKPKKDWSKHRPSGAHDDGDMSPLSPQVTRGAPSGRESGSKLSFGAFKAEAAGAPSGGGAHSPSRSASSKLSAPSASSTMAEFGRELQAATENGAVLLNERIASIKAKMRAQSDFINGPRWELLQQLEALLGAGYYQSAKALWILDSSRQEKPFKPVASVDEESCISTINMQLQGMNKSAGALADMLIRVSNEQSRRTAIAGGARAGDQRRGSMVLDEATIGLLSGSNAEEALANAHVDPNQVLWLPKHMEACLGVAQSVLKAPASITKIRTAANIVLVANRFKRLGIRSEDHKVSFPLEPGEPSLSKIKSLPEEGDSDVEEEKVAAGAEEVP